MEFTDYYSTLGVSKTATEDEIQKAYRKLARQYHPDVNKNAGAENRFKEIGEAHDVLKDPEKRSRYDRYGAAWKQMEQSGRGVGDFGFGSAGPAGFDSFYDVLEHLFGNSAGAGFSTSFNGFAPGPGFGKQPKYTARRGEDFEAKIRLTLEEAAQGVSRMLTVPHSGGENRRIRVTIPAGVTPGQRIRLPGQGGKGEVVPGDLYLVADIGPHPKWILSGKDLHTQLKVPAWLAALGGKVDLFTLTGKVKIAVPSGTTSGTEIRLKGQGYPAPDGVGDLYAEIEIEMPKRLTPEQKAAYQTLRSLDHPKEAENGSK